MHVPVPKLHVPGRWHESVAGHVVVVPAQVPLVQVSPTVHVCPSSQAVPFAAAGVVHVPVEGLYVPATWQPFAAVQLTGVPAQAPF